MRSVRSVHSGQRVACEASRHHGYRGSLEAAMRRAEHLDAVDRLLLEQVFVHGVTITDLARFRGERRERLGRRVASLMRRIGSPMFVYVAGHLDLLPSPARRAADLFYLKGRSLRDIARETGMTLHHVREHIRMVRALSRL